MLALLKSYGLTGTVWWIVDLLSNRRQKGAVVIVAFLLTTQRSISRVT